MSRPVSFTPTGTKKEKFAQLDHYTLSRVFQASEMTDTKLEAIYGVDTFSAAVFIIRTEYRALHQKIKDSKL